MKPISPSEIVKLDQCERLHGFKYLLKVEEERPADPDGKPAPWERGKNIHTELEDWQNHGTTPTDPLSLLALKYVPAPGKGKAEGYQRWNINGILYHGEIDLEAKAGDVPEWEGLAIYGADLPVITDYKSSSDPGEYGIWTYDEFLADVQAITYLLHIAYKYDSDVVGARWLHLRTRGKPKAKPADVVIGRDALGRAHLAIVEPQAKRILEKREQTWQTTDQVLALEPNWNHCDAYGGCPYQKYCGAPTSQQLVQAGYMTTPNLMGFLTGQQPAQLNSVPAAAAPNFAFTVPSLGAPSGFLTAPAATGFIGVNAPEVATAPTLPAPAPLLTNIAGFGTLAAPGDVTTPLSASSTIRAALPTGFTDAEIGAALRTLFAAWAAASK